MLGAGALQILPRTREAALSRGPDGPGLAEVGEVGRAERDVAFAGPEKGRRLEAILLDGLRYRPRARELREGAKKARKAGRRPR